MPGHILELTDDTFHQTVAEGVTLVDFYGPWCPPCKLLEPALERLATEYEGRAVIARVDVDQHAESATDNAVEDIPTLIFFDHGEEVERLFGAQKIETLALRLDRILAESKKG